MRQHFLLCKNCKLFRIVVYLAITSTQQNEHSDRLILGHVPLFKFNCFPLLSLVVKALNVWSLGKHQDSGENKNSFPRDHSLSVCSTYRISEVNMGHQERMRTVSGPSSLRFIYKQRPPLTDVRPKLLDYLAIATSTLSLPFHPINHVGPQPAITAYYLAHFSSQLSSFLLSQIQ